MQDINLLEIMSEFPEVKMWIDLDYQKQMIQLNNGIKKELNLIKEYQSNQFNQQFGLEDMDKLLEENSNTQLQNIKDILDEPTYKNITKHHSAIKDIIKEPLIKENDIENLILPKRNEIYIPQSYKYFYYRKSSHKKDYLDDDKWCDIQHYNGENIGKELFQALRDPYNINNPIIILGHPGAGKSMFSSQFAYRLIDNNEFIPFFIKLRDVDSTITDVDSHINQGINNTIAGDKQIDWTEMAEKFPDKIPVIILDGFDELLRATQTQLNDYILKIQKLQKLAQSSGLNIRVILTSRLTIMQDVSIPEDSLVIKLNSFDKQRKELWIKKWNEVQTNGTKFTLPDRKDINELSQEPLLLFLLALYDFEGNALSKITEEGLSRSSLYDKLFEGFTIRQLRKDTKYNSSTKKEKKEIEELFRLRIGFFATMLFLHDRVHHLEKDFDEELNVMGLSSDKRKAKNILDGFFFIHKDKSTDGHEIENLSFEFLHKTFGEFLAADFMLRVAKLRAEDDEDISHLSEEKYFRQIFSFQWIYKQPKILEFLFEHAITIVDDSSKALIKQIKKELKNLLDENTSNTLPTALHQLKTFEKLKHSAIYSQNLLLLWIALEKDKFEFNLSRNTDNVEGWKVLTDLWKNYGGHGYVSYLSEYIIVKIEDIRVLLKKVHNNTTKFTEYSNYTQIASNNYETILSFYDVENILLDDILKINYSENQYFVSEISNLIISRIEIFYQNNSNYFNDRAFWNLWRNCSFENKIRLSNFYLNKNIYYTKKSVAKYIFNSILNEYIPLDEIKENANFPIKEKLSFRQSIKGLKHFIKVEIDNSAANQIFKELIVSLARLHCLLISEQIKLLEISLEINARRGKYVEVIFIELIKNLDSLSISEQIKLLEISLEIDDGRGGYVKIIFKKLIKDLKRREKLSISEQIKLLEILLEIDDGRGGYVEEIFSELIDSLGRREKLSISEQIKLLEISLEINGGKDKYTKEILYQLKRSTKRRGLKRIQIDYISFIENQIENQI